MQIDGSGSISSHIQTTKESGQTQQNTIEPNKSQQSGNSTSGNHSDIVTLTSTASRLQQVEQQIASQPVVDTQRVEEMQQAIKNNSLKSDPQQVADKMVHFESLLNNVRKGA